MPKPQSLNGGEINLSKSRKKEQDKHKKSNPFKQRNKNQKTVARKSRPTF